MQPLAFHQILSPTLAFLLYVLDISDAKPSGMDNVKFTEYLVYMEMLPSHILNYSLPNEYIQPYCDYVMSNKTQELERLNATFCPPVYDGFLCWAPARGDSRPARKCPLAEYVDTSQFAFRYCQKDGVWENKTDYNLCLQSDIALAVIYLLGYGLSVVSLSIALGIFFYFKILRCLRNQIHINLIISFLIRSLAYFAYYFYTIPAREQVLFICNTMYSISNFAMLSNHIWMVMEGLYLFLIILCTYKVEKLKFWHFGLMGWGSSGLLSGAYCIVMAIYHPNDCWSEIPHFAPVWIVHGPILASLVINTLFLIFILYSLVIKVKATQRYRPSASLAETSEVTVASEYRKALKALLVLFPLLGIGHILFIIPPHQSPEVIKIYGYIDAVVLSTQGFFVALIYCFLNSEVRAVVRRQCTTWGLTRSFMRQRPCSMYAHSVAGNRRSSRTANIFMSVDQRPNNSCVQRGSNGRRSGDSNAGDESSRNQALLTIPLCRRQRGRRGTSMDRSPTETSLQSPSVVNPDETLEVNGHNERAIISAE